MSNWSCIVVSTAFVATSPCVASPPTRADFQSAWDDAATMTLPAGSHAEWSYTVYPKHTAREAESLLATIAEGDPGRSSLQQAIWLNGRPLQSDYQLWYVSDSRFRINEDTPLATWSPTTDATVNGPDGWICGANGVLTAVDLKDAPPNRDPRAFLSTIESFVDTFVNAGLATGHIASRPLVIKEFDTDTGGWVGEISDTSGSFAYRVTGEFHPEHDQFTVTELRITNNPMESEVGSHTRFEEYIFQPTIQRRIPQRVVSIDPDGFIKSELRFKSLKSFPKEDFDRIARLPDVNAGDPVRAELKLRRIDNFRPPSAVTTEIHPETGESRVGPLADPRPGKRNLSWKPIGWITAGLLVVFIVVHNVRRSS